MASIGGVLLILMMGLLVADVGFRVFFDPLPLIPEVSVFAMLAVAYLGLAACEHHREHAEIDFFTDRLPKYVRRLVVRIAQLISVLAVALLFYAVLLNALDSFQTNEGTDGIITLKLWPVKFLIIVGVALFCAELVRQFLLGPKESQPSRDSTIRYH